MAVGGPEGGSTMSDFQAKTDEMGRFELSASPYTEESQFSLVLTKPGYGGLDTRQRPWKSGQRKEIDVGEIRLRAECSLPVRVVDARGRALAGAVVEPGNSYAARTRIARTDENGDCPISGLERGRQDLSVRYGGLYANATVILEPGQNDPLTIKLKPLPQTPQNPGREEMKELSQIALELHPGDEASEWSIVKWTDAKKRQLSDYQGKTVVLIFWGVNDNNSISLIPSIKKLQQRFADRDVTFLGVHRAGEDMDLILQTAKRYKWDIATGVDQGKDDADSVTWKDYGSPRGLPLMVIDGAGKIAYNSSARPKNMQAVMKVLQDIAESINIPWPIDKDVDEETARDRMAQLMSEVWSREIEKTLAPKPK